jgi:hypothetical protein
VLGVLAGLLAVGGLVAGGLLLLTSGDQASTGHAWDDYSVRKGRIVVHYDGTPCERPRDSDVAETSERVEVTVWSEHPPGNCVDSLVFYDVRVDLDAPLGDRPVYDGACLADGGTDQECLRQPMGAAG